MNSEKLNSTGRRAGPPQARPDPLGGSIAVLGERGVVMTWVEDNNRYLAASLKWLRLRMQELAPVPAPAPVVAPKPAEAAPTSTRAWFSTRPPAVSTGEAIPLLSGQTPADALKQAAEERESAAKSDPPPALVLL